MKNLTELAGEKAILDFVETLWKTKEFQDSFKSKKGFIHQWIQEFSKTPRLFFTMDDLKNEQGHFTSWLNCVSLRHYHNDAVSDLYYLHEIIHATTLTYKMDLPFSEWKTRMFENELMTSLQSEVLVYFHLPTLRRKSFNFEIWADSYLNLSADYRSQQFTDFLRNERLRIYSNPHSQKAPEVEIAKYHKQNEEWAKIWKRSYNQVETFMYQFYRLAQKNKGAASRLHKYWIQEQIDLGNDKFPFPKEARAFALLYWQNKK